MTLSFYIMTLSIYTKTGPRFSQPCRENHNKVPNDQAGCGNLMINGKHDYDSVQPTRFQATASRPLRKHQHHRHVTPDSTRHPSNKARNLHRIDRSQPTKIPTSPYAAESAEARKNRDLSIARVNAASVAADTIRKPQTRAWSFRTGTAVFDPQITIQSLPQAPPR